MKKLVLLLFSFGFYAMGYSQVSPKQIDSIVNRIESEKTLKQKTVCDTFTVSFSNLATIECLKFYFVKDKLFKAIYSNDYHRKDSARNIPTRFDVFYYNEGLLIKVISKDFDNSPPTDIKFYLTEKDLKKFLAKETQHYGKYDGANYFIEFGYALLNEFKQLNQKVSPK